MPRTLARRGIAWFLLAALAPAGSACRRRIADILPDEGPRNRFEEDLFGILPALEDCVEKTGRANAEPDSRFEELWNRWRAFYEKSADSGPETVVAGEEYRLIMVSIDDYFRRTRSAWRAGNVREARRQEVALQHVIGELYGVNPGRMSAINMIRYTLETLDHLPDPTPESAAAWRTRLRLVQLRFDTELKRHITENPEVEGLERLGAVRLFRDSLKTWRRLVDDDLAGATGPGAEPLRTVASKEAAGMRKPMMSLWFQLISRLQGAAWYRKGIPDRFLQIPEIDGLPAGLP